jgi:UDP-4-amino-4,6-dideoxy-N-acetyl-beta-L-altrosamine transaminase
MIPYGRQEIDETDIQAVVEVLRSDFLTQGPAVPAFEAAVSAYCQAKFSVATNSATSALHLACLALGIGPGDLVWTSPITFVASANCALYCGAQVDFVDIDPLSYNMSVERLEDKLVRAESAGRLPKAVIPVHMCGLPCDMEKIHSLAARFGFKIVEDASHAIGAHYRGTRVGSCSYSDITVFSFHPVKIITTGEGGMAVTNDQALADKMRLLCSHGITRNPTMMTEAPHGPWYYQQLLLGFNYRLTDIQAALGTNQLRRLDDKVTRRNELARRYDERLSGLPLTTPCRVPDVRSAFHLYVVRVAPETSTGREEIFNHMRGCGIGVNLHYIPVYLQPYYRHLGFEPGLCPEAESYYSEAISLPMFPTLSCSQVDEVAGALTAAL